MAHALILLEERRPLRVNTIPGFETEALANAAKVRVDDALRSRGIYRVTVVVVETGREAPGVERGERSSRAC